MPHGDRLHRQRAFTQGPDHFFPARLDPLGDRDFAFTGQQFDTAHFTQIHPNRIIGPSDFIIVQITCGLCVFFGCFGGFGGRFVRLFTINDIDSHFREHRHRVFDLFRGYLILGQDAVQLINRQVAAFFALSEQFFNVLRGAVHQRPIGRAILFLGSNFRRCCFSSHTVVSPL